MSKGHQVQPWYVVDSRRRGTRVELDRLASLQRILTALFPKAQHNLQPLKTRRLEDIPPMPEVTAAHARLARQAFLGQQYDWLARLMRSEGLSGLELSIHRDDKAHGYLEREVQRDPSGAVTLGDEPSDPDLEIFRGFEFPLFHTTKLQMQEEAARCGFSELLEATWFCHTPLTRSRPCGYCNPCRYTREEGLGRRVPEGTPIRFAEYTGVRAIWLVRQVLKDLGVTITRW